MVAFTELGVDNVYTLEASLAGKSPRHFGAVDLMCVGRDLARALAIVQVSLQMYFVCMTPPHTHTDFLTYIALSVCPSVV